MSIFEFCILYYLNYAVMNISVHKNFSLWGLISWWKVPRELLCVKSVMSIPKIFDTFWRRKSFIFVLFDKIIFSIKKWETDLINGTNTFMEYWAKYLKLELFREIHLFWLPYSQIIYIMVAFWRKVSKGFRKY